jgi:hypothetical protein
MLRLNGKHEGKSGVNQDVLPGRLHKIDYFSAINGGLVLVPEGDVLKLLEIDYAKMVESRLFLRDPEPFKLVIERCADIQKRSNAIGNAQNGPKSKHWF